VAASAAPVWTNAYSVNFDGTNDFVTIGQPTDLDGASPWPLTISAWYRQADLGEQHYIISRSRPFEPLMTFVMGSNTDGTAFTYLGSVGDSTSGGAMSSLIWRHIVVTASTSGTTGKLYLDGVQVGSDMTTLGADDAVVDWLFGASRNLADNTDTALHADGNIDEVTFWNVEFSAAEVLTLYNGGVPNNPASHSAAANLTHYWPMGDGDTYPTLLDLVGTADGTMTNMGSGDIEAVIPELLTALTCTGSCDFNFVADSWSGTGNWSATDGGWTGVLQGSAPTRAVSTLFHSRRYVGTMTTSNFFKIAADDAHRIGNSSTTTYEFVFENMTNTGLKSWYGNIATLNTYGQNFYTQSSSRYDIGLLNTVVGTFIGGLTAASAIQDDKPVLLTITYDIAAPSMKLYINGTEHSGGVYPDTSTSGTLTPLSCDIAIGCRWSCNSGTCGDADEDFRILQIVRHQSVLDSSTITSRAAQFNRLKGY
jgi:hypothetical protein